MFQPALFKTMAIGMMGGEVGQARSPSVSSVSSCKEIPQKPTEKTEDVPAHPFQIHGMRIMDAKREAPPFTPFPPVINPTVSVVQNIARYAQTKHRNINTNRELSPHAHLRPVGLLRFADAGSAPCRRADDEERVEFLLVNRTDSDGGGGTRGEGVFGRIIENWTITGS